jgi:aldose 1-epimerase
VKAVALALALAVPAATEVPREFTLRAASGISVRFLDWGGIVTAVELPDRNGARANVVLGYATPAEYVTSGNGSGFGALIGRYAGRIAGGRFTLDGRQYRLPINNGANTLHGGPGGFAQQRWQVAPFRERGVEGARLSISSPDGANGFPGRLSVTVTYRLYPDRFRIDYEARTTKPTVLNLTNHSYFNLAGEGSGTVLDHRMQVRAARYVEIDAAGLPTGRVQPVAGTPFDFRTATRVGDRLDEASPLLREQRGFDHAWVLDWQGMRPAVTLADPGSGRTLTVETTEPTVQIYGANHQDGTTRGPSGRAYPRFAGLALETQGYADAPNRPGFPSTRLNPGQVFRSTTVWRFGVTR